MKKGHKRLLEFENMYRSEMGGSIPGHRAIFRGLDVFSEFKNWSWIKMLFYCVTGRLPSDETDKFLSGLYCMCFNYADPRIWNNRVSSLAATTSSTAQLAVCSAAAVSEAEIYGGPPVSRALNFLLNAKERFDQGVDIRKIISNELDKNGVVYGYGRPVNKNDERIAPTIKLLKELNLFNRPYIQFALKIQDELLSSKSKIGFNIGGVMAAFCADENITPKQLYELMVVCFYVGHLACFIDTESNPVGLFYPIRCERISYEGVPKRSW